MSPILLKGLIGAGTAGIVGTSGWGIFKFLEPKTIGDKVTSEGHTLPPFGGEDLAQWKILAKAYKDNNSDTSNKFSGLDITSDQNDDEAKKLRTKCAEIANKSLGDDDYESDYTKLKKWCVIAPTQTTTITPSAIISRAS